jgi:hypothetical protein
MAVVGITRNLTGSVSAMKTETRPVFSLIPYRGNLIRTTFVSYMTCYTDLLHSYLRHVASWIRANGTA